jgi:hypothetical protein
MKSIFGDIQSKKLIILKGFLFLLAGIVAAGVLIGENFSVRNAFLLGVAMWSFCRFYYFAFYVIEKYVDPSFKFAGLWSFWLWCLKKRT